MMVSVRVDIYIIVMVVMKIMKDVVIIVCKLWDGEGMVGVILNDWEIFDDARELMKDLKCYFWKFFWKE